ncbi:MAG: amylo-alpha-1,6-glucosidase [Bacteroidota bacterium]
MTDFIQATEDGERFELTDPINMPNASGFLWNKKMMLHMNCRGYAVAQFMQPEPAKYAYAPNLEAKTFMQPEQPYYAHHPGRFCYIKDEKSGSLFSAPYEPVRATLEQYRFSAGKNDLWWQVQKEGVEVEMRLSLAVERPLELWEINIRNRSKQHKQLSVYPYFPVGYMSWMNQSGVYDEDLCGIVCSAITPYQKYEDYPKIRQFKDKTFLLADTPPTAWEVNQKAFEEEGGLHNPSAIALPELAKGDARYETPCCALQYRIELAPNASKKLRFLFGPARTGEEIEEIRQHYFAAPAPQNQDGFETEQRAYRAYIASAKSCLKIKTPDVVLDNFVNHWLPRQVFYHGETNRLSTDPQTRNYLQDNMGMAYLRPAVARQSFLTALSQQAESGAMPDGILIQEEAQLKYINQIPHTDHCVWLPVCLKAYLDETNDFALLEEMVPFSQSQKTATVAEHIHLAMRWLLKARDHRGLSFIEQGDWCDPMNMVGPKGVGVSGWLSLATAYALKVWASICEATESHEQVESFRQSAKEVNQQVNKHLWDGHWYARGITDDNVVFGVKKDEEGRIFLNPQAWSILSGAADANKCEAITASVEDELETPYGVEMLGPPFTAMREDIGRVTQKFPGSAENGSVYNHAVAFYIFALFQRGHFEKAYALLRRMIPGPTPSDVLQRGQLPIFIPNYYRGAYRQFPKRAGRSSQLFNTGTVAWFYRSLVDGLFGLRGEKDGLRIQPQLPQAWQEVEVTRYFRAAKFLIKMERSSEVSQMKIAVDGEWLSCNLIKNIEAKTYEVKVLLATKK